MADKAQSCFFCTHETDGAPATCPMAVRKPDERGHFWFLSASASASHKNAQLQHDPHVQLLLQGSAHSDFLSVTGTAST